MLYENRPVKSTAPFPM